MGDLRDTMKTFPLPEVFFLLNLHSVIFDSFGACVPRVAETS